VRVVENSPCSVGTGHYVLHLFDVTVTGTSKTQAGVFQASRASSKFVWDPDKVP
jgi:hypothetical protein